MKPFANFTSVFCLFFCIFSYSSFSQNSGEDFGFEQVESRGSIPDDFLKSWSEKYSERLKSEIENGESGDRLERIDEFWLSQHHAIDELLMSGKLSFGDPITRYLNDIVDLILIDQPELRKQIRIYYYHSPSVNAFAVADGMIAVYTGLLAHVKSEAELAFVLCHEIAHFTKEHQFSSYEQQLENQNSGWFTESLNPMAQFERFVDRRKEQEEEADVEGLELFLKTKYSLTAIDTVLSTLHQSNIPYGRTVVSGNPLALVNPSYKIPTVFFRDDISAINTDEDYEDDGHTHPNIGSRRRNLEAQFVQRTINTADRSEYLVSEATFREVQKKARFEQIREKILFGDFTPALYDIYVLESVYPNNDFLTIAKVKALFGLASFKAIDEISRVSPSPAELKGPAQQMAHLIKQFNREQLISLALFTSLEAQKKFPKNGLFTKYSDILSRYLFAYTDAKPADFKLSEDELLDFDKKESDFGSPRAYYRAQQSHYRGFHRYLLAPYARSGYLNEQLKKNQHFLDSLAEDKLLPLDEREDRLNERDNYLEEFGTDLEIRNLVILDPVLKVRNVGDDLEEKLEALEQERDYKAQLPAYCRQVGIEPELLYVENMGKEDVERYNQFCRLEEWVSEASFYGRFKLTPTSLDIDEKININTKYVCRIIGIIDKDHRDHYYFGLFNLQSGKLVYSRYESVGRNLSMRDLEKETLIDLKRIYN
tara:strand:+ start:428 stop:2557 length:2130 start_codon:yes stop_codon:yes gene_type:complete